jgi:hypothetical protein
MLELALENARNPALENGIAGVISEAMKHTYDIHGADGQVAAEDVQLLSVFYNGLLFTWTVMPDVLAGRSPGELTRDALEKLLSARSDHDDVDA